MQVALIGLSQSGKTTLFSAVTGVAVDGNSGMNQIEKAIVRVPDERLGVLTKMYKPKKTINATIEFLDIPGFSFIDDAGKRQARQMLAQARQSDMLVAVLRVFKNDSVAAYNDRIDPADDLDQLLSEMLIGDMDMVSKRMEKLEKSVCKPSKTQEQDKRELALMKRCMARLENLEGLAGVVENPDEELMVKSFGFLTMKPMCVVLNVDEDKTAEPVDVKLDTEADIIQLAATLEAELAVLDDEDRAVFMEDMGVTEIARERLIKNCYDTVKLISFLTVGEDEVRAWTIPAGCLAPVAGGVIHSDIERGFIRAETVAYKDIIAAGDMKGAKAAGKVRLEGKTYEIQDGDIINFRFNV
ncbi:MAG: redox-regulated ATPase YchF [Phycisphaerae bacterium]|nr:redox-regulated ATPase YchF [Phycisphaerae bacterium]